MDMIRVSWVISTLIFITIILQIHNITMKNSFNNVFKQTNELSIVHLNIRSVPANFSQLRAQLDSLYVNIKIIVLRQQ